MSDQLDSMIVAKNFKGILARLRNEPFASDEEDSLCDRCLDIVRAAYKEAKDPAGDLDTCLEILQTMLDFEWRWNGRDDDIHLLLPLRRQLARLGVKPANRDKYYQCSKCVDAAIDKGSRLTTSDLEVCCW